MNIEDLKCKIYLIRGCKVMLDKDLAALYQVPTKRLNEQVGRNFDRFPDDFMFLLSPLEFKDLKSQIATSSWGGDRKLPLAFTEQGVAMLSGVLRSKLAVEVNIRIMRAFVALRQAILAQPEYALLQETVKSIESRMDAIEANHTVDHLRVSGKMMQLSGDFQDFRGEILRVSALFDHFQDNHIVIKRPEDLFDG